MASLLIPSAAAAGPAAYDARLAEIRPALAKRDFKAARRACRAAAKASEEPAHGGPRTARAWARCARIELAAKRPSAAALAYREAAHASVGTPKQRRKYLAQRRRAAFSAKSRARAKAITELLQHDARVQGYLRKPARRGKAVKTAQSDLLAARRAYRADRDRHQASLADAARVLVLAHTDRRGLVEKTAARLVKKSAPRPVVEAAWRALYQARVGAKEVRGAAEAAIRLNDARYEASPAERRRFARGRELVQACRALDAEEGPGACTRRQIALRGYAALVDHSRRRSRGPLSEAQLDGVHADALPALQACVLGLAKDDPERYRGEEITFSWAIGNDGRPLEIEVRPRRHVDATRGCVTETVAWFRYPRTPATAERRNVTVPYRLE